MTRSKPLRFVESCQMSSVGTLRLAVRAYQERDFSLRLQKAAAEVTADPARSDNEDAHAGVLPSRLAGCQPADGPSPPWWPNG